MPKAPKELRRYEESASSLLIPAPFSVAIEDAIIFQVHIWIMRRLRLVPDDLVVRDTLEDLQTWLGKPEGYEKLEEMV